MINDAWLHEFGIVVLNLVQLVAALVAAVAAFKALQKTKIVETKTDAQTQTLASIDQKADDAVATALNVDKKTDEQTKQLDALAIVAARTEDQTNGHLSKLHEQNEALNVQYISALEAQQAKLLDDLAKKQQSDAAEGGRRAGDKNASR